ncbi:helix-turn-helix domain-containing protein [Diaphorobacter ruginosibacter]|uniref:Helix-turn-helix domain-containing protein n=1 Tax=Diaphorobacter ruginosibacter TaxID=1715720 RepID=A0A7G9RLM7_9BURK|nr:helix-turn-helix domain-containing protein [Diaphorobacter ruginosibacter]QNN56502.1 helix-turn-helix domain-containing protein [Diaphorobacter ruginosibacter]
MREEQKRGLGERLQMERKKLRLSQGDVAAFVGVTRQAVSLWEKGVNCPSAIQLAELAALFCCCAHVLLFGEKHQASLLRMLMPDKVAISSAAVD